MFSIKTQVLGTPSVKRLQDLGVLSIEVKLEKLVLEHGSLTQKRLTCHPVCLIHVWLPARGREPHGLK